MPFELPRRPSVKMVVDTSSTAPWIYYPNPLFQGSWICLPMCVCSRGGCPVRSKCPSLLRRQCHIREKNGGYIFLVMIVVDIDIDIDDDDDDVDEEEERVVVISRYMRHRTIRPGARAKQPRDWNGLKLMIEKETKEGLGFLLKRVYNAGLIVVPRMYWGRG